MSESEWDTHYDQTSTYYVRQMKQEWDVNTWGDLTVPMHNWNSVSFYATNLSSAKYTKDKSPKTGWWNFNVTDAFTNTSVVVVSEQGFMLLAKSTFPYWGSGARTCFASSNSGNAPKLTLMYHIDSSETPIMEPATPVATKSLNILGASNKSLKISVNKSGSYEIKIFSIDGRVVHKSSIFNAQIGVKHISFRNNLSSSTYIVSIKSKEINYSTKVNIIQARLPHEITS